MSNKKYDILEGLAELEYNILNERYEKIGGQLELVRNVIKYVQEVPAIIVKEPPIKKYDNEHWNEILRNIVKDFKMKNVDVFYSSNKELADYLFRNYNINKAMADKAAWIINNLNGKYSDYIKQEFGISSNK